MDEERRASQAESGARPPTMHVKFSDQVDEQLLYEPRSTAEQFQHLDYFSNALVSKADLLQMAEEIVGEKPNWTFQDLQALRDLLQQYNSKLADELSDEELLRFLRSKCFDYEIAVQTIKNYHQLVLDKRATHFQSLEKLSEIFSDSIIHVLPYLDRRYVLTLLISPDRFNPLKHNYQQLLSALFHSVERILYYEIPQVTGIDVIVNLQHFTFARLKLLKPLTAKRLAYIVEECLPVRVNRVHVVGPRMISHLAYAILKPFLSQFLRSKIEFCSLAALHKLYPAQLLQRELADGAELASAEKWYLELLRGEKSISCLWDKFERAPPVSGSEPSSDAGQGFDLRANLQPRPPHSNCSQRNSSFPILNILPACTEYLSPFYK